MASKIKVSIDDIELKGRLKDTYCAESIKKELPVESNFQTWGDEFYFPIGADLDLDDTTRQEVEVGTIGYWPAGNALAIFFGPTPASTGAEPKAASDVNVVGELEEAQKLKDFKDAEKIKVELI
uniref:Protein containing DUF369 n=1 Tax=uncultured organism TaxID=155900 RepID=M1PV69_9ZZZZ|nr:protein containing DUF369 [uncultured organism]